ncbi:MAG: 5-(carboxyamino)imidazole ribonucleotide mutase [Calditrichia bacterium]
MAKVAIMMGSESDRPVVEEAVPYLQFFGLDYEIKVMSAHRTPLQVQQFAAKARENGFCAIIAAAGMAAHLPGVVAAYTTLPVIGVPLSAGALNGVDALYSIVQMPAGVPVATMAIGKAGARNAAIYAAQIAALSDAAIQEKLNLFKENQCKLPK